MKNILITGVTGFAGSYLLDLLLQSEARIHGTYNSEGSDQKLGERREKIQLHKVDLTQKEEVDALISSQAFDEVYHLAAATSPSESFKDPQATFATNINSQLFLLDALKNTQVKKIVTISTSEMYGMVSHEDLPVNEFTPFRPLSPYAVSKITQDYLSYYYFLSQKLPVVRVRPFNHTGPGQEKFVVPSFARQIAEIEKNNTEPIIKVGNLNAKKDFSDVRDIVKAYTLLMEKGVSGEAYNVGSGKSIQIKEILTILLSLSKVQIAVREDPSLLRPIEVEDIYSDNTKITKDTGWAPVIDIKKTLSDSLDYFRKVV